MIGRLRAELQPAYVTSTRAEVLNLNMIARGKPSSSDIGGAIGFLRLGDEWIVRGFAETTTPRNACEVEGDAMITLTEREILISNAVRANVSPFALESQLWGVYSSQRTESTSR